LAARDLAAQRHDSCGESVANGPARCHGRRTGVTKNGHISLRAFDTARTCPFFREERISPVIGPPYQISVVTSDLTRNDTQIALTNSGASATTPTNGGLCFNVYAMTSAQGDVAACCTCRVQPNGLGLISVNKDLLGQVSQSKPRTAVVKLMASLGTSQVCNASSVGTGSDVLATGMLAWQVAAPQVQPHDQPPSPAPRQLSFRAATLSAAELSRLDQQCSAFAVRACNSSCGGP
jgi:hypothetical protein